MKMLKSDGGVEGNSLIAETFRLLWKVDRVVRIVWGIQV